MKDFEDTWPTAPMHLPTGKPRRISTFAYVARALTIAAAVVALIAVLL